MGVYSGGRAIATALVVLAGLVAGGMFLTRDAEPGPESRLVPLTRVEQERQRLFEEIQPVRLANCELERFGEEHDGGYLLCANLLGEVRAGYSYGISGYDQWGCDVSTKRGVRVHQYDCFNLTRPQCSTGDTVFHGECIGDSQRVEEGRPFDTLENQIRTNGDAGNYLVVKMDVEGAEWDSFLGAPAGVLQRIDQMAVEFHRFDEARFILAMMKLREHFYVVDLHWNNFACDTRNPPFPAWAYEVLFVNKRIGVPDPGAPFVPSVLHRPNDPNQPDCQAVLSN